MENIILYPGVKEEDFHGATEGIESGDMKRHREIRAAIGTKPSTEALQGKREPERFNRKYDVIELDSDSDVEEEFHAVMESTKYEDSKIQTEDMEFARIDLPISSEIHEISISDQSLQHQRPLLLLCRLCAVPCNDMIYIFGLTVLHRNIIDKIQHCLAITVKKTDTLSKHVCRSCLQKLESCHQFHEAVKRAQTQLLLFHEETSRRPLEVTGIHRQTSSQRNDQDANNVVMKGLTLPNEDNGTRSPECENQNSDPCIETVNSNRAPASQIEQDARCAAVNSSEDKARSGRKSKCHKHTFDSKDYSPSNSRKRSEPHLTATVKSSYSLRTRKPRKYYSHDDILCYDEPIESCASPGQKMKCQICKTAFQTYDECKFHASVHASTNNYPCCFCDENLESKKKWKQHWAQHVVDPEGKQSETEALMHSCDECGNKFATEIRLKYHKLHHKSTMNNTRRRSKSNVGLESDVSPQQEMTIGDNQREVSSGDAAKIHSRTGGEFNANQEKEESDYPSLKEKYQSNDPLEMHKRYLLHLKPGYTCNYCKKSFSAKEYLRRHITLHTGERPYRCDICSKGFRNNFLLKNHRMLHTGERPFACTICGKTFRCSRNQKRHAEDIHLEKKTYPCLVCNKIFAKQSAMSLHMFNHSGRITHDCNLCGAQYVSKRSLGRHTKIIHGQHAPQSGLI